jgi:hypothetical protein
LTFPNNQFYSFWPIGTVLKFYLKHVWGPNSGRTHTLLATWWNLAKWQNWFI